MYDFASITSSCVKCGKCIQNCTIYQANSDETTSPRGFIELLGAYQNGDLKLDKTAKNIFESCFLCTNCTDICPNSLPVDEMIENVRYDIAQKYGLNFYKRVIFFLLGHRKVMDLLAKMGFVFQSCAFKIQDNGMKARFSLPMIKKGRLLPSLASRSFLNSHQDIIKNGGKKKVGIFIGCFANYMYQNIGEGLLKIFKSLQIDAYLLKKQACCGAPAYFTGDFKAVEKQARHNIAYFEENLKDLDAIVIPEATCSAMIKHDYVRFFASKDPKLAQKMQKLNEKIFMATEYLAKFTNLAQILEQKNSSDLLVTYHDPCHARKVQGVFKEPRELLSKNFKLSEMSNPNACCGFGGVSMQTQKFHLAQKIGTKKVDMIEQSGALIVSAECSACKMQISNALNEQDSPIKFKNPIELIAEVL